MKNQRGQAAILIVFVLGMVAILIGLSLTRTGFRESIMGRSESESAKAFYAAQAGVEEAFFQIGQDPNYAATFNLPVETGQAQVTVSGTSEEKIIESVGTQDRYVRKLKVEVQTTSLKPGFTNAVQAGQGGLELEGNTLISSDDPLEGGNVFSNSSIWGAKQSCGVSGSRITGSAWAVDSITKLEKGGGDGVCIIKDAHSSNLEDCSIGDTPFSPNALGADCSSPNPLVFEAAPTPIPLPDMGLESLKNFVKKKQIFTGDCIIGSTPECYSVDGGVATLGEIYITGNLIKPNATDLNISGPVYVEGNIDFGQNSTVGLAASVNAGISQIVVAKGKITSSSNISYTTKESPEGQKMFLIFISDREPPEGDMCENPDELAIELASNSNTVLFYAAKACIQVKTTGGESFHGAILGEKIRITSNTILEYDPDLKTAIFGLTKSGGWMTVSFKEE
ncbi:MAG: pilus assembly PilX N-terminal domain-containing protein [bacterium]|nr:pilus assembly PilX N-terminal domain-containing protein [bacterium]